MSAVAAPIGPVDVAVVVFPEAELSEKVTAAVADAIASGAVRLLDALIVQKSTDGEVTIIDVDDEGDIFAVLPVPGDHQGLLSEADANEVGDGLEPGSSAVVVAWENMWAVRLRSAIFEAGGVIVAHERIADDSIEAAYAALDTAEEGN
ncbi:hypothetical protein FOE78_13580 [Microlunatus elymi]|uniref:DUF1269 domain-containing protein n=1 Tax=Microlunatus elymi TaxID=2596828 RepID=A0A516Q053_9ACTN|nr:DUF6325 family protein [Microlunatus elymi]QDP96800.1 hypothetical protein FOE78_13580 [Microlunatus elymi]